MGQKTKDLEEDGRVALLCGNSAFFFSGYMRFRQGQGMLIP